MKLLLTADYEIQLATADGTIVHGGKAGDTITVPEDVAALFITAGVAEGVKSTERATKAKGETATK
jgi:hypothetical protein